MCGSGCIGLVRRRWERKPVMYAISDDRSRRPGRFPAHRELPVLFHLRDVSQPRPPAPGEIAAPAALPAALALPIPPPAEVPSAEPPVAEPTIVNLPAAGVSLISAELPAAPPAETLQAAPAPEPTSECVTTDTTAINQQ